MSSTIQIDISKAYEGIIYPILDSSTWDKMECFDYSSSTTIQEGFR